MEDGAHVTLGQSLAVTLDQAVSMALTNNRGLSSSALDIQKAKERKANRTGKPVENPIYTDDAAMIGLAAWDYLNAGITPPLAATATLPITDF